MKALLKSLFLSIICASQLFAQIGINNDGSIPDTSAQLDVKSTTKGFLMPRMTAAQRMAIFSPSVGLQVYQSDGIMGIYYFSNLAWNLIGASTGLNNAWQISGNDIYNTNSGYVGIGTNTPAAPLTVFGASNARLMLQTTNTGTTTNDGLFMGIFNNVGSSAVISNLENGTLNLGTNAQIRLKIEANGNIGIGEPSLPALAMLHVQDKSVLFTGPSSLFGLAVPPAPVSGQGSRTFWYPEKGAFRTGAVSNSNMFGFPDADISNFKNWDKDSIGIFSFASGFNTKAKGDFSVAMGYHAFAIGNSSTAFGRNNVAKGDFALTAGYGNNASGSASTALGNYATALGDNSFAVGDYAVSSGNDAFASGANTEASGIFSTAMGYSTTASGKNSVAMGKNANTNLHANSFCLAGITSNLLTNNTTDNQMMMRFDNYTFFVGATNNYAYIIPASNGWSYVSDRNRKENFIELNGENVLRKIAKIPFYSWNFKAKESRDYRHYGIMAQDFHENFGKDELGVIGNDTTVSALDLLGVAYSAIKALEKRTVELQVKNHQLMESLHSQNETFTKELCDLRAMIILQRRKILVGRVEQLENK